MRHKLPPGCKTLVDEDATYCQLHKKMALERMRDNSEENLKIKALQKEIAQRIT